LKVQTFWETATLKAGASKAPTGLCPPILSTGAYF
jgi:hypothetical protein